MEDDRVEVDLGLAAEIEEVHIAEEAVKQPKKRFVGRRTATEAAAAKAGSSNAAIEDAGAVQGMLLTMTYILLADRGGIKEERKKICN